MRLMVIKLKMAKGTTMSIRYLSRKNEGTDHILRELGLLILNCPGSDPYWRKELLLTAVIMEISYMELMAIA